jgi:protein-disulfide isomerase
LTQLDVCSDVSTIPSGVMQKLVKTVKFRAGMAGMTALSALFALLLGLSPVTATAGGALPADQDMAIGDPKAPVTVIEYASMTCPHCAHFHDTYLPDIKKKYIDTGKVRLVFREFPLDRAAWMASILARCSGEDRFFPYIDILFTQQAVWSRAKDPKAELLKLARMGGVSDKDFNACMSDKTLGDGILQTRKDGQDKHEINSTPSFVIDGKTHAGAMDIEAFSKAVEPLLK